ncbi:alkaline shock response membrane anchor protein AmaP [Kitasatospora sp. NPDC054939]
MSRTTVNRLLIGLAGLVLLAVGLLVLAGGFDLYARLGADPPDRWPLTSPDQPLLSTTSRTRWTDEDWWWPAVITALVLAVAGAAWWLVAQLRRSGPGALAVATPGAAPGLRLRLRTKALEDAVETGTAALPEVERATVRVTGARGRLRLRGAVRLAPGGDPAALLERFDTGPRQHSRTSLALPELPADLRVHVSPRPADPAVHGGRKKHPRVQ